MRGKKSSIFYRTNKILEIMLFSISVLMINILLSEKLYWWALVTTIVIILLEIFLKNKEYNYVIKEAVRREEKSRLIEVNGITNHYFMYLSNSKNSRNREIANAIDQSNEMHPHFRIRKVIFRCSNG